MRSEPAPEPTTDPKARQFLVIDDHPLICEASSPALRADQTESKVCTASSLSDGIRAVEDGLKTDAILLDLNLPDVHGVDGPIRMRARVPDTPVVVISSHDDARVISKVPQAGATAVSRAEMPRLGDFPALAPGGAMLMPDQGAADPSWPDTLPRLTCPVHPHRVHAALYRDRAPGAWGLFLKPATA